jgi:hypothetical protein
MRIDESATGAPLASLKDLRPGNYTVQAVLHVYETVRRSDGHVLKLPWDDGEGQHWNRSPGNLISTPKTIAIRADSMPSIELTDTIPPIKAARRYEIHPARALREQAADAILGSSGFSRRNCFGASRFR